MDNYIPCLHKTHIPQGTEKIFFTKIFCKSLEGSEESIFNSRLGRGDRAGFVEKMLLELDPRE